MPSTATEMLMDQIMPEFDATVVEHLVVEATPEAVYQAARSMDFLQVHSPMVDAAMFMRSLPDKIMRKIRNEPDPPAPAAMRLGDMFDGPAEPGAIEGWLALEENEGRELVFGAVGKVWQPDIEWRTLPADAFGAFAEPDYAKIVVGFSVRPYGRDRTLLSYEARTRGTDQQARRRFLRYWSLVRVFVRVVMRAAVRTVKDLAEEDRTPAAA